MAMIIHELATNAAKHGALSTRAGKVMIEWRRAKRDHIVFKWTERGGPPCGLPAGQGVGSTVITRAAAHLRATVDTAWAPEGLTFKLNVPKQAIAFRAEH
jgi:two-component sensor histidine kinase